MCTIAANPSPNTTIGSQRSFHVRISFVTMCRVSRVYAIVLDLASRANDIIFIGVVYRDGDKFVSLLEPGFLLFFSILQIFSSPHPTPPYIYTFPIRSCCQFKSLLVFAHHQHTIHIHAMHAAK